MAHIHIYDGLVDLSLTLLASNRCQPLVCLLVTLPRTAKSQDIFRLCHISIKVDAYTPQNALTQCYNWAACGVGAAICTPTYCNCQLAEGETTVAVAMRKMIFGRSSRENQKPQPEEFFSPQILQHQLRHFQLRSGAPHSKTRETIYAMRKYRAGTSAR
jgi:hypothetical protein